MQKNVKNDQKLSQSKGFSLKRTFCLISVRHKDRTLLGCFCVMLQRLTTSLWPPFSLCNFRPARRRTRVHLDTQLRCWGLALLPARLLHLLTTVSQSTTLHPAIPKRTILTVFDNMGVPKSDSTVKVVGPTTYLKMLTSFLTRLCAHTLSNRRSWKLCRFHYTHGASALHENTGFSLSV